WLPQRVQCVLSSISRTVRTSPHTPHTSHTTLTHHIHSIHLSFLWSGLEQGSMQGSTHPRCSGTCGRDGKGRKLEGSLLHHASHNSDGHWWCSKCRSKGKPTLLQRTRIAGSSLVLPARLNIAKPGAAVAAEVLQLHAPNIQIQSHSD